MWKRGENFFSFPYYFIYVFLTSGVKLHIHLLNEVVQFIVFFTLSTLICRSTDISKCFGESLGIRDIYISTQQLCENIRECFQETNQPALEREASKIKRIMENIWYKNSMTWENSTCKSYGMKIYPRCMKYGEIIRPLYCKTTTYALYKRRTG